MRTSLTTLAAAGAAVALAATLSGCAVDEPRGTAGEAATAATSDALVPPRAEALLARYGLDGMNTRQVVDHLDRLGLEQRPADLMASVRPDELVVSSGKQELSLDIPGDRFYLSVAPYVSRTHECFHHSLTTCKGELSAKKIRVRIVDETNQKVLVSGTRTTFDNGFVGFWLPRGIEGTVRVSHGGRSGQVGFVTDEEAPTCLTGLRLT